MDKSRFEITSKQLVFVIVGSQIATGILSLPRALSAEAGQHAWIAVILGAVIPLLSIYLIVSLYQGFSEPDFINVSRILFGKILGSFLVASFILYIIFFQSIVIRLFAEITKIFLLPKTPLAVIIFLILLPVYYAASKGAKTVARLNEILFWILLIDLLVLLFLVPYGDYTLLMPLNEVDFMGVARATRQSFYSYAGIEVFLIIYVMVNKKEEIMKAAIIGQSIVVMLYLLVVIVSLLVFGPESMRHIMWPVLNLLSVHEVSVIERLEIIFLLFWLGIGARPAINLSLGAAYSFYRLFNLPAEKYYVWISMLVAVSIYIIALWPEDLIEVFKWADYGGAVFLLTSLGYPLFYHIAKFVQKGRRSYG